MDKKGGIIFNKPIYRLKEGCYKDLQSNRRNNYKIISLYVSLGTAILSGEDDFTVMIDLDSIEIMPGKEEIIKSETPVIKLEDLLVTQENELQSSCNFYIYHNHRCIHTDNEKKVCLHGSCPLNWDVDNPTN